MSEVFHEAEPLAERIAARGPEALLARLREAYAEAARAQSDVISVDEQQIEDLVQRSVSQADGLLWRRALAGVASQELQVEPLEALNHPAVARAQQIVGAPSYEESLAELRLEPLRGPEPARRWEDEAEVEELEEAEAELEETAEAEEALDAAEAHDESNAVEEIEVQAADVEETQVKEAQVEEAQVEELEIEEATLEEAAEEETSTGDQLHLTAVHLGGVAELRIAQRDVGLLVSEQGIDLLLDEERILGRLAWPQIRSLDIPTPRGWRRRLMPAQLIIRTRHGDVSFEITAYSADELRPKLEPLARQFGPGLRSRS